MHSKKKMQIKKKSSETFNQSPCPHTDKQSFREEMREKESVSVGIKHIKFWTLVGGSLINTTEILRIITSTTYRHQALFFCGSAVV